MHTNINAKHFMWGSCLKGREIFWGEVFFGNIRFALAREYIINPGGG